jgi:hypothetical protein
MLVLKENLRRGMSNHSKELAEVGAPKGYTQSVSIKNAMEQFSNNLEQIRDFVELLEPLLSKKGQEQMIRDAKYLAPFLLAISQYREVIAVDDKTREKLQSVTSKDMEIVFEKEDNKKVSKFVFKERSAAKEYELAVKNFHAAGERPEMLFKSALISLISSVECHFSNIFHYHYSKDPEAFPLKSDRRFSYSELKTFQSVQDAAQMIIEDHVEGIIRSSLKDWIKKLREEIKIKAEYLDDNVLNDLSEFFLRRNLVVHNNGIVNSIYLNKAASHFTKNLKKGQRIFVGKKYLENAITILEINFILMATEVWIKNERKDKNFSSDLFRLLGEKIAFRHLETSRYSIAENIYKFLSFNCIGIFDESSSLVAKINYWQSVKWQDRFEEVRNDVEKADFSAKDSRFIIAKYVLLDRYQDALKLIPVVLKSGQLTLDDIKSWPLFQGLRKDKQCIQLVKKLESKVVKLKPKK